jgi:hypothetical protein
MLQIILIFPSTIGTKHTAITCFCANMSQKFVELQRFKSIETHKHFNILDF